MGRSPRVRFLPKWILKLYKLLYIFIPFYAENHGNKKRKEEFYSSNLKARFSSCQVALCSTTCSNNTSELVPVAIKSQRTTQLPCDSSRQGADKECSNPVGHSWSAPCQGDL